MDTNKSIRQALEDDGIHLQRPPHRGTLDISGYFNKIRDKNPVRYEHLQFSLESVFEELPNEQQREGAFTIIQYLNSYLWKAWFDLRYPLDMRTVIKTIDDAYTSMCDFMPENPYSGDNNKVNVVEFLVQTTQDIQTILRQIDPQAPVPHALHDNLYLCLLGVEKFNSFCVEYRSIPLYTEPNEYTLDLTLYAPDRRVTWQMGQYPTTVPIDES